MVVKHWRQLSFFYISLRKWIWCKDQTSLLRKIWISHFLWFLSPAYLQRRLFSLPPGFRRQHLSWQAGRASRWPLASGRWVCFWSWPTWTKTWMGENGWVSNGNVVKSGMKSERERIIDGWWGGGVCVCVCVCILYACVWVVGFTASALLAQPATMAWFMSIWFSLGLWLQTPAEQDPSCLDFQYTAAQQQQQFHKNLFHWPIFFFAQEKICL